MPAGLALALLAQAAAAGTPDAPAEPVKASAPAPARQDGCANPRPGTDTAQIVICAPKPEGYRLNPDVMEAKRAVHGAGRPTRPGPTTIRDTSCAVVGPAGCFQAGINLIATALLAAEMSKRLAEGKEVGSLFITDPHPDEYHLYLAAKARREAREKEKAAAVKAKAAEVEVAKAKAAATDATKDQPPAQPAQ